VTLRVFLASQQTQVISVVVTLTTLMTLKNILFQRVSETMTQPADQLRYMV
jgi:hypothetical protein